MAKRSKSLTTSPIDSERRFQLTRPNPKENRTKFSLVCYFLRNGNRKDRVYCDLPKDLEKDRDSINEKLISGIINQYEANILFEDLIQKQYKKNRVLSKAVKNSTLSNINQNVFNDYWKKHYQNKPISDKESARYDILKALRLIDPISINTATSSEIQNQLEKNCLTINEHRRAIARLKQLLKFLNRDIILHKPSEEYKKIKYVTLQEFELILKQIPNQTMKNLATVYFATGMRKSEALAIEPSDIHLQYLNVNKQLTKTRKVGANGQILSTTEIKYPKRQKKGKILVLKFGLKSLHKWAEVQDKDHYRYKIFDVIKEASIKAFPKNKDKWICVHDLRHSHAIHLLSQGASLTQVALNLRNTIEVCQKYYTGYEHTDQTLEALKKIIAA